VSLRQPFPFPFDHRGSILSSFFSRPPTFVNPLYGVSIACRAIFPYPLFQQMSPFFIWAFFLSYSFVYCTLSFFPSYTPTEDGSTFCLLLSIYFSFFPRTVLIIPLPSTKGGKKRRSQLTSFLPRCSPFPTGTFYPLGCPILTNVHAHQCAPLLMENILVLKSSVFPIPGFPGMKLCLFASFFFGPYFSSFFMRGPRSLLRLVPFPLDPPYRQQLSPLPSAVSRESLIS